MTAGTLRDRFDFYERLHLPQGDGRGNFKGEWLRRGSLAARRETGLGREQVLAKRLEGISVMTITVRYSKFALGIHTDMMCRDTRTREYFAIKSVTPLTSRDYISIALEGRTALG